MAATWVLIWKRVPQPAVNLSKRPLTLRGSVRDYWRMLRRTEVAAAALAFWLMFLGVSLYVVYLPTWLETSLGATSRQIAALFLIGGIANVLTGPQAGRLSDRVGRKVMVLVSCIGLCIVMLGTVPLVTSIWVAYPVFFVMMILVAMRVSPFSALLTSLVSGERRGSLMSLTVALGQVGFAIGASLAGPLYASRGYSSNTVLAATSVLAMGVVVWLFIPEPEIQSESQGPLVVEKA